MRTLRALVGAATLACTAPALAQSERVPVTGDRLGGFVIPTEPGTW
jgi:hypothetical protein